MRLFLGIELPSDLARRLLEQARERWPTPTSAPTSSGAPPPRWAMPEDLHVTLRFLGEPDRDAGGPGVGMDELTAALERLTGRAADLAPTGLDLSLERFGCFPSVGPKARVLWAGPRQCPDTWADLATAAEEEARALGFRPDDRPFRPHVTLLRPRPREAHWAASLAELPPTGLALTGARSLALFSNRGTIERRPPRYRVEVSRSW